MYTQRPPPVHSPVKTEPFRQRDNAEGHCIVNFGISVQTSYNTMCAIEYLKSHNIDQAVIERVLLYPELRRTTNI